MDGWMHRPPLAGNMKRMHVCTTAERLWFDIAMQMHAPISGFIRQIAQSIVTPG